MPMWDILFLILATFMFAGFGVALAYADWTSNRHV
jgi:hypothetical protein